MVTVEAPPFSATVVGEATMVIVAWSSSLIVAVAVDGLPMLYVPTTVGASTVTVALALPSPTLVLATAVTVQVALVALAAITIGLTHVVVYRAAFTAGGVKLTDNGVADVMTVE